MYLTRFGYFVMFSIIAVAVAAVVLVIWPFGDDGGADGSGVRVTPTLFVATTPSPTPGTPVLPFSRVVDFAGFGAVLDIRVTGDQIIVNLRPDFDVSGLNTTSHTFTTSLPSGANSVEGALQAAGIEVNGETGVPVIRQ